MSKIAPFWKLLPMWYIKLYVGISIIATWRQSWSCAINHQSCSQITVTFHQSSIMVTHNQSWLHGVNGQCQLSFSFTIINWHSKLIPSINIVNQHHHCHQSLLVIDEFNRPHKSTLVITIQIKQYPNKSAFG